MERGIDEPAAYVLGGEGLFVSYDTNRRLLRLCGRAPDPVGGVQQIDLTATVPLVDSAIGRLATAEVIVIPDAGAVAATLVVPDVNLGGIIGDDDDSDQVDIETVLLFTIARSSIAGPSLVHGQVTSNEIVPLRGVAKRSLRTQCGEWYAVHDQQPPGPFRLIVTGECTFPTAGYSVTLRRHVPAGINRRDLLLDLIVTEPTGPVAQVITTVPVRYEEETDDAFDTVTILPDGPTVPVVIAV